MSFSRKNWSALSSLAQQWSAEDEEEQERERRRRHRQLSSSSDTKQETPNPEQKVTCQVPNSCRFRNSSEVKPSKLGNSILENERKLVGKLNKQDNRRTRWKGETLNNVKRGKETVNARKLEAEEEKAESLSEPIQEQKDSKSEACQYSNQQKISTEEKPQKLHLIKREPIMAKHESLEKEENPPKLSKDQQLDEEQKVQNAHESQRTPAIQNEETTQKPQRAAWERKSISRLEVKINSRVRNSTEVSSPPSAPIPQATERSIPKIDEADSEDGSEVFSSVSHPLVTYSSSFKRISPRTISFRVVPPKDKQDTLSRSASMRLPANTAKFGEKLEKYTSAVQRAGSIKLPPSARRNFQPLSEGVASKRNIFEANVAVRAEPITTVRKESLTVPGGVSSRINLWISRSQEPSKDEGIKDIQRPENMVQQS